MKLRKTIATLALAALGVGVFVMLRSREADAKPTHDAEAPESASETRPADRDADLVDDERSTESTASNSPAVFETSVTIVSAQDRRPISDAAVSWWTSTAHGVNTSDAEGSVALPLREVACWISAAGYQDVLHFERLTEPATIELPLGAGLEISFHSSEGPEVDVQVEAALELTNQAASSVIDAQRRVLHRLSRAARITPTDRADLRAGAGPIWIAVDGWKQVSDERGIAAWRSLPPGRWRWRLLSQRSFTITPAFERAGIEFDGAVARANQVPRDTSGAFELVAGKTLQLECGATGACGLRGRIAFADRRPAEDVRVLLRRVEKHIDPLGVAAPVDDARIVGQVRSAADGSFEFQRLEPGRFSLTAVHADAEQRFDFVNAQAEVADGESRDLGVLALGGAGLAGRIDFVDAASGRVLKPESIAASPGVPPRVTLEWTAPNAYEVLSIAVSAPFEIRGLEPGRYYASIDSDTHDWGIDGAYTVVGGLPSLKFDAPGFDAPLQFAIPLTKSAHIKLRGRVGEPSRNPWSVHGKFQASSGTAGADFSFVLQGVELDASIELPPGDYWICAQAATFDAARSIALQRFTVPADGGECVLDFRSAVEVSGIALSSEEGAPLAGKLVFAAPIDAPAGLWFFDARANESGEFALNSLPIATRIRFKDSADVIDTRAAGVTGAVVHFEARPRR